MRKTVFTDKRFYYLFVGLLMLLLLYNIYITLTSHNVYGLLPIFIEGSLLAFIFSKSKSAKLLIQIWTVIFLIIVPALELTSQVMTGLNDGFEHFNWSAFVFQLFLLGAGILFWDFIKRTVKVSFLETNSNSDTSSRKETEV
jgi:hypothetical protein